MDYCIVALWCQRVVSWRIWLWKFCVVWKTLRNFITLSQLSSKVHFTKNETNFIRQLILTYTCKPWKWKTVLQFMSWLLAQPSCISGNSSPVAVWIFCREFLIPAISFLESNILSPSLPVTVVCRDRLHYLLVKSNYQLCHLHVFT